MLVYLRHRPKMGGRKKMGGISFRVLILGGHHGGTYLTDMEIIVGVQRRGNLGERECRRKKENGD